MRSLLLCSVVWAGVCGAQTSGPVLLGAGNLSPFPLPVAPGQLLTLFVQTGGGLSPVTSFDVSAVLSSGADQPMPVLQVNQANTGCNAPVSSQCPEVLAVTVQVPFGIVVICPFCATPVLSVAASITVSVNGVKTPSVAVQPLQDQIHLLTICDVIVAGTSSFSLNGGLPCTPMITHADGRVVSNILPAKSGEELVAYATGLGQTNPQLTVGRPASQASPTVTTFGIDFNYRVNALATEPGAVGAPATSPLFTGATKGYVGLYQINFIVPPPPAGLQPCVDNATALIAFGNYVRSNLTVSIGSTFSFDGGGICVTP
jgi:uncharacterized protein (TIGR03437 family)